MTDSPPILIATGDGPALASTTRILRQAGYQVLHAPDGETTLALVREQRQGLVLLDVFLPDISGPEVLRQIRLDPTLIDVLVLMISALEATPEQLANCLDTGADGFMASVTSPGELLARVRSYLRRAKLNAQLRASEERYRWLFESNPQPMYVYEVGSLRILDANEAAISHYGYNAAEFRALTIEDLYQPDDLAALHDDLEDLGTGARIWQHRRKDGSLLQVEITTCAMDMSGRRARLVLANDITDRILAEDALRASERKFSTAFEFAAVGMALIALDGRILKVNRALCQMLGYSAEVLLERNANDLAHPADAKLDAHLVERLLSGTVHSYQIEKRYLTVDRTPVWTMLHVSLLRDDAGQAIHFISQIQDVTARREAAAEFKRTADLLQAVVDGTNDCVFVKDLQGRYLLINKAAQRMVNVKMTEIIGHTDGEIFGGAECFIESDRLALESQNVTTTEDILEFEGQSRTFLSNKALYYDGRGNVAGIIGISRDITNRKLAEQQIAAQAALIDQASDAIYEREMDGRVMFWSKGSERIYGWTVAEAVGRAASELFQTAQERYLATNESLQASGGWQGEIQKKAKDGTLLILDSRLTLVRDASGAPRSVLVIDTDITARKKIEQQLLRSQRMESIGTLAGGIAHDLNNALAPIIMALDLMQLRFPDRESQALLSVVNTSAHRGADMVRQVLSFARGMDGKRVEVAVNRVVLEVGTIAADTFPPEYLVRTRLPEDLWQVSGDPTQLHQVLMNLALNARDAMPGGGTLVLSAGNIMLDAHHVGLSDEGPGGPYVFLQVEDSGVGMAADVLEKIFDPFFTTKEFGKGTGLGLSTSLAIVKSHGGFIRCYSEPGNGAKFSAYLPAILPSATEIPNVTGESIPAPSPLVAAPLPRGSGQLILVVDDEESVRQITRRTLETYGYRVVLASDGAEAVAIFGRQRQEIAAILTDMSMPVMDGATTIQILRHMDPDVPIIATSGFSIHSDHIHSRNLGVQAFLSKPFPGEALLTTLAEILIPA
jgi:PAS domain S-box-containing protein